MPHCALPRFREGQVAVVEVTIMLMEYVEAAVESTGGAFQLLGVAPQVEVAPPDFAQSTTNDMGVGDEAVLLVRCAVKRFAPQAET